MSNNARYITYPLVADARDLMQRAFTYLQTKMPGWTPSEGQLDTWMIEAIGGEAADIASLTTEVPKSIFRYFGARIFNIEPIDASRAVTTSTWFLTDALGHTIPAGTQVGIYDGAGNLIPFEVLVDVIVAVGSNQTAAGAVTLIAVNAGVSSNDIGVAGGTIVVLDTFSWIDHVTITAVTTGGQDAETDDDYLSRLAVELQTMSPTPILPVDFAILSRNVAGVQRAAAVDGYNPADGTFNNERMITVVAVDSAGNGVAAPIKAAISAYLESLREINFVVNTADPAVSLVDVTAHVNLQPGWASADVQARVASAITSYLDPANWGISQTDDPNDPITWNNDTIIYYLELATLINNVAGVDRVTLLEMAVHGNALASTDLDLAGVVPLPNPDVITVVITA